MGTPGSWQAIDKAGPARKTTKTVLWILLLAAVAMLLGLGTCGRSEYRQYRMVDGAVAAFHGQLDRAQYEDIYGEATDQFRGTGSRQQAIAFLKQVHGKMGASGKSSIRGLDVSVSTQGRFVSAAYASEFAQGPATESFVWRMDQDQPRLWNYQVDSPNLR
jgi:hypothetical protein